MTRFAVFAGGALGSALLLMLYSRMHAAVVPLGFVALVPWLVTLRRARSVWDALLAGAVLSVAFSVCVLNWLPGALERYAHGTSLGPWVLLVFLAPVLQPQFLSFAVVRHIVQRPMLAALAAAAAYVGTELTVGKLLFDTIGMGLYPSRALRQGADVAGVHGLTLLLILANEGVAAAFMRATERRWRAMLAPLACAASLVVANFAYGMTRLRAYDDAPRDVTVGIVQANVTNYDKLRAERGAFEAVRTILDTHYALSEELIRESAPDVIVWPETVYPTTFGSPKSEAGAALDAEIVAFAEKHSMPLVFGAYDSEAAREYNAAFFLSPKKEERTSISVYRKGLLFPFTERMPAWLDAPWLREALPWTGRWEPGPGPSLVRMPLREASLSVLPLICYDVLFPAFVAEAARGGADVIVTLSNDSWFPDARAPELHLVAAAFRSIETRLPQVRATNSGISAFLSPAGDRLAAADWGERRALSLKFARGSGAPTLAMRLAPWLGPVLLGAALLIAAVGRPRVPARTRSTKRSTEAPRSGERAGRPTLARSKSRRRPTARS